MTNAGVGMPCPVCTVPLVMSDRQGVEIDYCPQCRGVWLDRGELDKIIERTRASDPFPTGVSQPPPPQPHHDLSSQAGYARENRSYRPDDRHRYPKRKKSFLEELFD